MFFGNPTPVEGIEKCAFPSISSFRPRNEYGINCNRNPVLLLWTPAFAGATHQPALSTSPVSGGFRTPAAGARRFMDKLQIGFFFISGFLISRLIIKAGLPERIVSYVLGERHVSITGITFYLIAVSAFLSFFIPNAITVLTMLPVLELLRQAFEKTSKNHHRVPTLLALSVIYGSNIGGMATITGTPANGILITYLEANSVAGTGSIQFATWLAWGLPLSVCLVVLAWLVITALLRPYRFVNESVRVRIELKGSSPARRRWGRMPAHGAGR